MEDDLIITDWNEGLDWFKYIGPEVREVWNTLPYDMRNRMMNDAAFFLDRDYDLAIEMRGDDR